MRLKQEDKVDIVVMAAIKELIKDDDIFIDFIKILSDSLLYGHVLGVAKFSVALAMYFNYSKKEYIDFAKAGLLHDIGKQFINRDVLYKAGRLTDAEFELVKQHPQLGYNSIKDKTKCKLILDAVLSHHEKIDEKGYPNHIAENDLAIQIITVADIFSALTEARVYKKAMPMSKALEIMVSDSGLNQEVVNALYEVVYDDYEYYLRAKKLARYYRQYFKKKHIYSFDFED